MSEDSAKIILGQSPFTLKLATDKLRIPKISFAHMYTSSEIRKVVYYYGERFTIDSKPLNRNLKPSMSYYQ